MPGGPRSCAALPIDAAADEVEDGPCPAPDIETSCETFSVLQTRQSLLVQSGRSEMAKETNGNVPRPSKNLVGYNDMRKDNAIKSNIASPAHSSSSISSSRRASPYSILSVGSGMTFA